MVLHGAINQKWHEVHGYDTQNGRLVGGRRLIWSYDFALLVRAMRDEDWADFNWHCLQNEVVPLVAKALRDAAADCRMRGLAQSRALSHGIFPIAVVITTLIGSAKG